MDAANASESGFTSILAGAKHASLNVPPQLDYVFDTIANVTLLQVLVTLLAMCVVYDQCRLHPTSSFIVPWKDFSRQ